MSKNRLFIQSDHDLDEAILDDALGNAKSKAMPVDLEAEGRELTLTVTLEQIANEETVTVDLQDGLSVGVKLVPGLENGSRIRIRSGGKSDVIFVVHIAGQTSES